MENCIDQTRYELLPPSEKLQNDIHALKKSVNNSKQTLLHNENHLLNLQLLDEHGSTVWLKENKLLLKFIESIDKQNDFLLMKIMDSNRNRQSFQQKAQIELTKIINRRDQSILRNLQIQKVYVNLYEKLNLSCINSINNSVNSVNNSSNSSINESYIDNNMFNIEKYINIKRENSNKVIDPNDPSINSTVREYETINTMDTEEMPKKKMKL